MNSLPSPFHVYVSMPNFYRFSFLKSPSNPILPRFSPTPKTLRASIKPPPPDFDYRSQYFQDSRAVVAQMHPELLDLVDNGRLFLIQKNLFGPVPIWRTDFVEPDAIWLVGTSHISEQSSLDVERVVRAVKPESVVVELCRSRAGIMYASNDDETVPLLRSNMFSLSGSRFLGAVSRSINLGGQTALALRLLLAVFSSKISSDSNRPFGDEFRAARKASEEVGAQIVLGDRPIEITLGRAWSSLKWNEKLGLVTSLLRGITSPSLDVSGSNLKYLAWSLKRSKAVNKHKRVVGVIGKGHINGVIYALVSDLGDLRFRDLVGKRPLGDGSSHFINTLLKSLVRDFIISILIWALFEQLKSSSLS